ncbi:transmembrane protein 41A-like [Gigantopelta aegis]|uniref:transmembrane protein 41A-like n=1 Tax=Gigantopelta aegis TaxID=1735272 RepID=UPI001B88C09A|nr:transmembrane protein 41A-like [Gigantopelta aegis]
MENPPVEQGVMENLKTTPMENGTSGGSENCGGSFTSAPTAPLRPPSARSVLWIPVIFAAATYGLYALSQNIPKHRQGDSSNLKFPTNIDDLQGIATFLQQYRADHAVSVMILFICAYLYKQSFAIPGSVFLNLLAGSVFGTSLGFPLVCFLTAVGASTCYMLSNIFGKSLLVKYFPNKVQFFQDKVEENLDSLFFFLLFLRLFPMSPNWFMNMVAPIVNVPLPLFFMSVLVGLMPYNFICVQTGSMLSEIRSLDDIFTLWTMAQLAAIALMALIPGFVIKTIHAKKQKTQ